MKVFSNKVGIKRDFPEKKFCIFSLPKFFVMLIFLTFSNASPAGIVPFLLVGMAYYHSDHLSQLTWYHLDHLSSQALYHSNHLGSLAWYHCDMLLQAVMVHFYSFCLLQWTIPAIFASWYGTTLSKHNEHFSPTGTNIRDVWIQSSDRNVIVKFYIRHLTNCSS